ncbi:MAG TPA: NADH-quinone oxidoreductase subunit NuoH [Spartobacteria bacterium]|jgi:NADH-quinone oxidoreductase subunit H|nr:NADH-quinone oxidoreductase subunit NuoH [Spartobacteria bacterium]HCP91640.1 NADH-quinone oxidoreductase subunit NuoH [Spartobacteria bacterium]
MNYFFITTSLLKIVGMLFVVILPMVSYSVYAERRVSAFIQDRLGPNRVGPAGLFQPIADIFKLLLKEDFTPRHVNTFYYWLAPCLALVPAIITIAVVPFGSTLLGVPMVIADINVGILYVFAVASLGVYGIVLAGWASNSKYPFLGGVRSSSQMISYELSLGLAVIPVFLLVGNLRLTSVVRYQIEHGWMIAPFIGDWTNLGKWLLTIPMIISFVVFTIAVFAETNRLPFDLPEAEQELAGGYHTEYSSMKFALFFLGEYAAMISGSAIIVTLFLGGWHLPLPSWHGGFHWLLVDGTAPGWRGLLGGLFNIATFFAKVAALLFIFMWVRWTLPRFRYDQLMRLGWLFFFEIALANIFLAAIIVAYFPI